MLTTSLSGTRRALEVERRSEPRAQLGYRALVRLQNKLTCPARLRDLSSSAAQILCDSRYGLLIDPSGRGDKLADLSPVELAFALPAQDFRARCRIEEPREVLVTMFTGAKAIHVRASRAPGIIRNSDALKRCMRVLVVYRVTVTAPDRVRKDFCACGHTAPLLSCSG